MRNAGRPKRLAEIPQKANKPDAGRYARFWPLWLASIVVPLLVLSAAAWWSWNLEQEEARSRLGRTIDMLGEQALRAFETQDALLVATQSYTADMSWDEIASSAKVSEHLRVLDDATPDTSAIGIVSPAGRLLHYSRAASPLSETDMSDRDYVQKQRGQRAGPYVAEISKDPISGQPMFAYSRPHLDANGQPDGGVLWAAFTLDGFADFYHDIVENPRDVVALVRDDGAVLASYPPPTDRIGTRLSANAIPMRAVHAAGKQIVFVQGAWARDGIERIFAVRGLPGLPVSIIYGLDLAGPWNDWVKHLLGMGMVAVVSMALLLSLSWLAVRRAQREEIALHRARQEAELRAEIEAKLRQGQRLEVLGQIAAGMAHDFRNIIHVVHGSIHLVEQALERGDPARAKAVLTMVAEAADRGGKLAGRVLGMAASPRPGKQAAAQSAIADPIAVVEAAHKLLARGMGGGCTIRAEIQPDDLPWRVRADPAELEAAILNLAFNARDAMPGGGEVVLTLTGELVGEQGPPHPEGLGAGHYARIIISDTGIGMDSATLARATEAFFTTKPAGRGTGLGLATVRAFVQATGGGLRITSAGLGCGTSVTIWLPKAEAFAPGAHLRLTKKEDSRDQD
jgi:signal transduction histidine kinase